MMKKFHYIFILLFLLGFLLVFCNCGGGGSDSGDGLVTEDGEDQNPSSDDTSTTTTFPGFDLALQKGDFWEYGWDYEKNFWDSFSGGSHSERSGAFRLTLGEQKEINGVAAFELIATGSGDDYKPRWKYLAISQDQILGSEDGVMLVTLFDAQTGIWPGSGFFTTFSSNTLYVGSNGTIDNDYISGPAIVIQQSFDQDQCQYFPGIGTICGGDYNETVEEREYYREGIGPLGYYSYSAISDMTGQYPWSSSTAENVGLLKSSLRGDTVDYDFETEPNDSPDTAQAIGFSLEIRGEVVYDDDSTSIYLEEPQEEEPNDSRSAPQALNVPAFLNGSVDDGDSSSSFQFWNVNQWNTINAEDWYSFTLNKSGYMHIELSFSDSTNPPDLDLYLFSESSDTPSHYSVKDNPNESSFEEGIYINSLAAGSYFIAVDAWDTPDGSTSYTLEINDWESERTLEDWYSFTLDDTRNVTIYLDFECKSEDYDSDMDLYLFDQTGSILIASSSNGPGIPEEISMELAAGTYKIGLDLANSWGALYYLTVE